MRYMRNILAAALAAVILLTGCSSGATAPWAFRSGADEIPVGVYMLYASDALHQAGEEIQKESGGVLMTPETDLKGILNSTVEGKPAADWVTERVQKLVREHVAVNDKFLALGLELTDSEKSSAEKSVTSAKSGEHKNFYSNNGVSDNSLREYYTTLVKKYRLFAELYGEGGEMEVPETELKDYFVANYVLADMLIMYKLMAYGDTASALGKTDEEIGAAAEGYLERLKAGEEIEELAFEWQREIASTDEDRELIQKPSEGSLAMVISESDRANFGDELTDSLMGLTIGEPELIDDPECFIVANRVDILENELVFLTYKSTVLSQLKSDDYNNEVASWGDQQQLEENSAVLTRYSPAKLNFK